MTRTRGSVLAAAILMLGAISSAGAGQQKPAKPKTKFAAVDLLPLTCVQAWDKANRNYGDLREIVVTLARVSLANRDLTLPNTREAGTEAGKGIAENCKADPNALLYAIVDKYVLLVAQAPTAGK